MGKKGSANERSNSSFARPFAIAFRFRSKRHSGNARLLSLLDNSKTTKVIEVNGFWLPGSDRVLLALLPFYRKFRLKTDLRKFNWIHIMGPEEGMGLNMNQILHLDDPTFDAIEQRTLALWDRSQNSRNKKSVIICTSERVKQYCKTVVANALVEVVPQGFITNQHSSEKFPRFACVYSSPYIFFRGDRNSDHPTWGSTHFLEELIPKILDIDEEVDVHLIGRLGKHALEKIRDQKRIFVHGLVSPEENSRLLSRCHLALYPRLHDHGRRVLKISEYMGAGLPVVAYLNEDSTLVSELNIGIRVRNSEEFVSTVARFFFDKDLMTYFENRIKEARLGYEWSSLAKLMDKIIMELNAN